MTLLRAGLTLAAVMVAACSADEAASPSSVDAAPDCCPITYTGACNCFQVGGHRTETGACPNLCDVEPPKLQQVDDNGCPKIVATAIGGCYPK